MVNSGWFRADLRAGEGKGLGDMTTSGHDDLAGERRRLEEARCDFLAAVTHDLRTPLASIIGFGCTLEERWPELSDEERALFLRRIVLNGEELERRIANFLEYSRLDSGEPTLDCGPCDLGAAVAEAVERTRLVLERHLVLVSVPDDIVVVGDERALARVVENLLGNAAKYSPPGTAVHVSAERLGEPRVIVSVDDDGPGVSPDDAERIFDRFYRAADTGRGQKGAGIGLAGVRQLVCLMGGRVWVETPAEGGSRFRVSLEAAPVATMRRPEPAGFLHSAP
jgi:signal transduction histidine kinase